MLPNLEYAENLFINTKRAHRITSILSKMLFSVFILTLLSNIFDLISTISAMWILFIYMAITYKLINYQLIIMNKFKNLIISVQNKKKLDALNNININPYANSKYKEVQSIYILIKKEQ